MYSVYSEYHSHIIVKEDEGITSEFWNFEGQFKTFREAKRFAIQSQKNKIECFKIDVADCRRYMDELKSLKKGDL